MRRAEVLIEDDEGGNVAVRFVWPAGADATGFDPKSPAHQLCNVIKQHLDKVCTHTSAELPAAANE